MTSGDTFVTVFSIPKPFTGQAAIHQTNAVRSWVRLGTDVQVQLCGDEEGVAEAAASAGAEHVPRIARNEHGTPLLSGAFEAAKATSRAPLLCYVNADIILMSDFIAALKRTSLHRFLLCGRRWDLDLDMLLDFDSMGWENHVREAALTKGSLHAPEAMDYFVFPRDLVKHMPPFAVGRAMWDNWFVFNARVEGAEVVDATQDVVVVHQNHGYAHTQGGQRGAWYGPEAGANRVLAREMLYPFTICDATLLLIGGKLKRPTGPRALLRLVESKIALTVRKRAGVRNAIRMALRARNL